MIAPSNVAAVTSAGAPGRYPLRVVAIMDTAQVSGPGRQLAALAVAMQELDVDLRVVLVQRTGRPRTPYAEFLAARGVRHVVVEEAGPFDLRLIGRVRGVLDEWHADIVQTHGYKPTALAFALRRMGNRRPWIAFFHGSTAENAKVKVYHWLDRRLRSGADRVVVMSRRHLEAAGERRVSARVIHNCVIPEAHPQPNDESFRALIAGLSRPLIGVIGRLSFEKGVDVFLQAVDILKRGGTSCGAVIAGDGPERERLESLARELGVADDVRFVGALPQVAPLYPLLDLVVIPSRSEGLPNVLLEALRADRPVVATRVGAVAEVLVTPAAGGVVEPGSPDALARAIEHQLAAGTTTVARAARAETVERFSLSRRAAEHLDLYRDLMGARAVAAH